MLDDHLIWLRDKHRLDAYREALQHVVFPGMRVLDLGCGSGILGLLALQAGAAHVDAVDHGPIAEVAMRSFGKAGFAERVRIHRMHSTELDLETSVDLVLCDHVGYFGIDYGIQNALHDAGLRLLRPDGIVMPRRLRLYAGAVEAPQLRRGADDWAHADVPSAYHWVRELAINQKRAVSFEPTQLLGPPLQVAMVELGRDAPATTVRASASMEVERTGTLHGITGWFEAELADDIWMTNSPLSTQAIDRPCAFFAIAQEVAVREGDVVDVDLLHRPSNPSLLSWSIQAGDHRQRHSTWQGTPLRPGELRSVGPDVTPASTPAALAVRTALAHMDGRTRIADIAQVVASTPGCGLDTARAIKLVERLARQYGR